MIPLLLLPVIKVIRWVFVIGFLLAALQPVNAQTKATSVLKGKIVFKNTNAAKGFQVIIVPNTSANEQLTKSNKFLCDNGEQLKKMNAQIAFTNSDGTYYFKSVTAGKYILKVCTLNGYKYNFIINSSNFLMMTIKDLPATF